MLVVGSGGPVPASEPAPVLSSQIEVWSGAQAFRDAWALYSGATVAPFGAIGADGVKLRAVGGYGAYSYVGTRATAAGPETVEFKGSTTFADALVGYQKQLGPLTLKVFAGLMAAEHDLTPDDPRTAMRGAGVGAKAVLEGLVDRLPERLVVPRPRLGSLHDSYSARLRFGWRVLPALSAGVEAGAAGNVECDIARAGVFLRYEWASGELAVSGGLSNDKLLHDLGGSDAAHANAPYATVNWLTRF